MDTKKSTLLRLGFVIVFLLVLGMVFASLAEDVVNRESLSTLDPILGNWLIAHTSLTGDRIFSMITFLGDALVISAGTGLMGLWLAKRKRWNQLLFLFSTVGGAALLNLILKNIFLRPRPIFAHAYLVDTGFSFPSGHAMISLAFYGAVACAAFLFLKGRWSKVFVTVAAILVSFLIGFSRMYLGVHYLTDVLAGWAAGGIWLVVCILGHMFIEAHPGCFLNLSNKRNRLTP
jgi:membrane-associated phospholipid phosphatase